MNKKMIAIVVALALVVAALAVAYFVTRPSGTEGMKSFTVEIVHKDGTTRTEKLKSDAEFLGEALVEKELIVGHDDIYGLVVDYVDGERAAWDKDNAFWNIYIGEEAAVEGISKIPVHDGDTFKLVYTPFN